MKRVLAIVVISVCTSLATDLSAQTYGYMTFRQMDGTQTSLAAHGLRLTFEGDHLIATVAEGWHTFNLATLASMRFTEDAYFGNLYDINLDGTVDVGDVTLFVSAVLGGIAPDTYDLNGDAVVDVGDVTVLVNQVLQGSSN